MQKPIELLRQQHQDIESDIKIRLTSLILDELDLIREEYGDIPRTVDIDIQPASDPDGVFTSYQLADIYIEL